MSQELPKPPNFLDSYKYIYRCCDNLNLCIILNYYGDS